MAESILSDTRIGRKFGRLTVLCRIPSTPGNKRGRLYLTLCDCGTEKINSYSDLNNGSVKSCGCSKREHLARVRKANPVSRHPLYTTYQGMISRCYRPSQTNYRYYGARGIKVCQAWLDDFWQFVKDVGEKPGKTYQLDRIDSTGNYEPGNVRWLPVRMNQRRSGAVLLYLKFGEDRRVMLADYCRQNSLDYNQTYSRLHTRSVKDVLGIDAEYIRVCPPCGMGAPETVEAIAPLR